MTAPEDASPPEINDRTSVTVRLGNLLALLGGLCVAAYAYAVLVNRVSVVERDLAVDQAEIDQNSDFRVRWPLGELGELPADVRQDLRLQFLEQDIERLRNQCSADY